MGRQKRNLVELLQRAREVNLKLKTESQEAEA
jgi:hypothetical protein